jgi:hypothetical protein
VDDHDYYWFHGISGWDAPPCRAYNVTSIPSIFLIGADGTLLARNLRGGRIEDAVEDILGRR